MMTATTTNQNMIYQMIIRGERSSQWMEMPFDLWEHLHELPWVGQDGIVHAEPTCFFWIIHFHRQATIPPRFFQQAVDTDQDKPHALLSMAVRFGMDDLVAYLEDELVHGMMGRKQEPQWTIIPESP